MRPSEPDATNSSEASKALGNASATGPAAGACDRTKVAPAPDAPPVSLSQANPQPSPAALARAKPPSALPHEPPQLACLPLARSDEPVIATIVPSQTQPAARPVFARAPGQGHYLSHRALLQEFSNDPFPIAALYARALFSQAAQDVLFGDRPLDKIYSVPRRFDLSTLFVVSTAFAMLFTLLGYLEFSSWSKLAWCFFFSGVGVAQAALYHGRAPRLASVLAGGFLMPLLLTAPANPQGGLLGGFCLSLGLLIAGLPGGYIAGTLIGGVFLVADKLRNKIADRRAARAN